MISEKKLNLACGQNKVEGYFGVDIVKTDMVDAIVDLMKYPWDIESESAEEIICSHYIEHINHDSVMKNLVEALFDSTHFKDFRADFLKRIEFVERANNDPFMPSEGLFKFMDEVYRILVPKGKIRVIAPYYTSIRAIQDPTHVRSIGEVTFMYFNKEWRKVNGLDHYSIKCDFDFTYWYNVQQEFLTKHEEQRNFAMKHYCNVIDDIDVTLVKKEIV
jgi:predicted SAM-dependent methyltransferase